MHEALAQIWNLTLGVWRYRWIVLLVAWLVAIASWAVIWRLPESYVATARVYVDTNSILRPLLRGLAIQPDMSERVAMMSRTLLSRPNLERLMRMTDLDLEVNTEIEKEEMVESLQKAITLSGDRNNTSLYSIAVEDSSRDASLRIAQSLITVFIENSQSEKRDASADAQSFIDEQIRSYEKRLVSAEERLGRFKQEHLDILPGSDGGYYERLQAAQTELDNSRLALRESENRRNELRSQLSGEDPVFLESSDSGNNTVIDARVQALKMRLDTLLSSYTERHPEVRQVQALLDELEKEKEKERKAAMERGALAFGAVSGSPVYQSMRSMLAETEGRVAELRVRVSEYENRIANLKAKVHSIPEVEIQLKQLNRDYTVLFDQHQQLLQRRESARLSDDVEQTTSGVSFRVVDPPFTPIRPSKPNKLILNAGGLLLGLGAGVGIGLLISLLFPVYSDTRSITTKTGLPLLGVVTYTQPAIERAKARANSLFYLCVVAALPMAFVIVTFGRSLVA
ncbi:MAG: XrtA system polysaccharide chain length determinant [Parahaliea sp.]